METGKRARSTHRGSVSDESATGVTANRRNRCEHDPPGSVVLGAVLVWLAMLLVTGCGSGATIQSKAGFNGTQLAQRAVLVVPIAVAGEFEDDRSGVILSDETREKASRIVCRHARTMRDDVRVVCWEDPAARGAQATIQDITVKYARDQRVPGDRWRALHEQTGADFVLLVRPESGKASSEVDSPTAGQIGQTLGFVWADSSSRVVTTREYVLSGVLVDLSTGEAVRAGVHSDGRELTASSGSTTLLQIREMMETLAEGLLDD